MTPEQIARGLIPSSISFERQYSDNSGVQYGVDFKRDSEWGDKVGIDCDGNGIEFPLSELDWFIASLMAIRAHLMEAGDGPA